MAKKPYLATKHLTMKKLFFFLLVSFFISCSDDDDNPIVPIVQEPESTSGQLFSLDDIPEITLEFPLADWNKLLSNYDLNPKNEKKVVSHFTFNLGGDLIQLDSVGLKLKGNTSRRRPEGAAGQAHNASAPDWHHCHFSIDFSKNRDDQRFKGLNKINLKWFKDDPTYAREIYCYDLFRRFGVWTAPRASYCKLRIKVQGDATPAYYGVYAMIESVDEDYLTKHQANWGATPGFLWKGGYGTGDFNANFVQTTSMGVEDVTLNPLTSVYYAYDLKTREDELAAAKVELTEFITNLNTKTGTDFKNWISQKMDIPLFLKTYATSVMVGMWDDYWGNANNFYFYFAGNGKAYFIPYDYDNTLGTSLLIANAGTQNPFTWGPMENRPLVTKILAIPEYYALYKNYIDELANPNFDYFAMAKSAARIFSWQQRINLMVPNDTGEDMLIEDRPAYWGNQPNYRLLSGNNQGGSNGAANYFSSRTSSLPW